MDLRDEIGEASGTYDFNDSVVEGVRELLRKYIAAAEEAVVEQAAEIAEEYGDSIRRALKGKPVLETLLAQARLEEAKWWRYMVHEYEINCKGMESCVYCKRLAELETQAGGVNEKITE